MQFPVTRCMRKFFVTFLLFLPLFTVAQEFDFAKKIGGNTLYFTILTTGGKNGPTVGVCFPGTEEKPWKGYSKPRGQVAIPDIVTPDRSKNKNADSEDDDTTAYKVVSVCYNAFQGCDHITKLVLPNTINRIEEYAFDGCKRIEYIVCEAQNPPRLDESSFDKVDINIPLRVPIGTYEKYKQSLGWRVFTEILEY